MCSSLLHQKLPNNGNQDIIEQEAIESVHWQKFEKKVWFYYALGTVVRERILGDSQADEPSLTVSNTTEKMKRMVHSC